MNHIVNLVFPIFKISQSDTIFGLTDVKGERFLCHFLGTVFNDKGSLSPSGPRTNWDGDWYRRGRLTQSENCFINGSRSSDTPTSSITRDWCVDEKNTFEVTFSYVNWMPFKQKNPSTNTLVTQFEPHGMAHTVWATRYGPYCMGHITWFIVYGSHRMTGTVLASR